jgi:UDP-N-acetylglucosamine 4,6-dehydratase
MQGKTVLVTGGTGTFGSAVVARYLNTDITEIRIFSRDEYKQHEMREQIADSRLKFYLGDVRDAGSLVTPMRHVDYVFHASALKQVPSCEQFPLEAIKTNTIGAENVFNAAIDAGVSKVVSLSTDKAVKPTTAMGASKMLMEKLSIAKSQVSPTAFCITRYGNVLASRGSIIPKFVDQILAGQPITITNPSMTRYLMTIDEAVDLVLFAHAYGFTGDTFVKKDPASTIITIANALKQILNADNEIKIIGARTGEKLHETLMTADEQSRSIDSGDYYRVPTGPNSGTGTEYTSGNTKRLSLYETVEVLKQLECVQSAMEKHGYSTGIVDWSSPFSDGTGEY